MKTDITELAQMKGQKVEAPYYLAECTECGKMYSSSKLIVSRNYFDGDADCYCPHCNAEDADIADLGSGEQPAVMAWNYQQARIDALVEALEKAQAKNALVAGGIEAAAKLHERIAALTSENAALKDSVENAAGCINTAYAEGLIDVLAESSDERLVDLVKRRLLFAYLPVEAPATDDALVAMGDAVLLEQLEDSRKAIVSQSKIIVELEIQLKAAENNEIDARCHIADLESRTVKMPKLKMLEDFLAEVAIEERKQILVGVKLEFHRELAAAGIKVEAE